MSAPTHTPSLPLPAGHRRPGAARPARRPATGANARLHWWALALPALAFVLLLLLLAGSGQAHAATAEPSALLQVTGQLLRALG